MLVTLIAEGIGLPAGLITAMVMTRGLGPEVYGHFTVVATTVAVTEWLLIAILTPAVVKFVAESHDWQPVAATAFRVYVLGGLVIGAALWALAGPLAAGLGSAPLAGYFRLFAVQVPLFAAGAAGRNVLAGRARYREQALSSAGSWTGRVVFIVLFVELGFGIEGAIVGSISGTLAGSAAALALAGRALWGRAGFAIRRLTRLAAPAFLTLLCARLLDQVGLLMLEVLTGGNVVGYYGAAMNVMLLASVVGAAVTPVLISTVTAARFERDDDLARRAAVGALRFGLVLFPLAAVVAGSSVELAPLLFGPRFAPAAPIMAALMIAAVARANMSILGATLIAIDRAWTSAAIVVPLPAIAIAAHLVVIPRLGGLGAALVTMVAALGAAAMLGLVTWRVATVLPPLATVVRTGLLSAAAYTVAATWVTPGALALVKVGILGLGVVGALFVSGELSREELRVLRGSLPMGANPRQRRTSEPS